MQFATIANPSFTSIYDTGLSVGSPLYATTGGLLASATFQGTIGQSAIASSSGTWTWSLPNEVYIGSTIGTATVSSIGGGTTITVSGITLTAAMVGANVYQGSVMTTITSVTSSSVAIVAASGLTTGSITLAYSGTQLSATVNSLVGPVYLGVAQTLGTINAPTTMNIFGTGNDVGWSIYQAQLYPQIQASVESTSSLHLGLGMYVDTSGSVRYSSTGNVPYRLVTDGTAIYLQYASSGTAGNTVTTATALEASSGTIYFPQYGAGLLGTSSTGQISALSMSAGQIPVGTSTGAVPTMTVPTGTLGEVVVAATSGALGFSFPSSIQMASPSTYTTGTCSTGNEPNTVVNFTGSTLTASMAFGTLYVGTTTGTTTTAFIQEVVNTTSLILATVATIPAGSTFTISYGGAQFAGAKAALPTSVFVGASQALGVINSPSNVNILGSATNTGWNIYGTQLYPQMSASFDSTTNLVLTMATYLDSSGNTRYSSTGNVGFELVTTSTTLTIATFASGTAGNTVSGQVNAAVFTQSGIEAPTISTNTMVYSGASNLLSGLVVPAGLIPTTNGAAPIAAAMVGSQVRSVSPSLLTDAGHYHYMERHGMGLYQSGFGHHEPMHWGFLVQHGLGKSGRHGNCEWHGWRLLPHDGSVWHYLLACIGHCIVHPGLPFLHVALGREHHCRELGKLYHLLRGRADSRRESHSGESLGWTGTGHYGWLGCDLLTGHGLAKHDDNNRHWYEMGLL